jgi:NodT family efflux transporter outer membrane factor (OMF) lipoprotein
MRRAIAAAAASLALGACVVGPDYQRPAAPPAASAPFVSTSPAYSNEAPAGRWWSLFGDPGLDALVEEALGSNTDLRVAEANLRRARAALRESRSARLPSTSASASATYSRSPAPSGIPGAGSFEGDSYDIGLGVSYDLDLFGRIHRAIEASRADAGAVEAARDLARINVAAETTRAYADACSAALQLGVAQESVRLQQEVYDLTRRLLEGGRATALETSQAQALLEQTRASIPALEAQRQGALFRLAVLLGRPPAEAPQQAAQCNAPPSLARPIPVGDGAALLARRPDIREAERSLAAATARIGVATADLYPSVSLGGSIGSTAGSPGNLFSSSGFRFSLGPLISWTIPNVAAARARIAQAQASADAALATFDGTWLAALRDTETALTNYARELDRLNALRRSRAASAEAVRIARLRFDAGRESFQVVLDAETALAQSDAALASSQAALADDLVTLFLALGGGWQEPA